jgi:hypothetical protein
MRDYIYSLQNIFLGDENKENDVNVKLLGSAGSGQSSSIENLKERSNFGDLGVDGKRILKCI